MPRKKQKKTKTKSKKRPEAKKQEVKKEESGRKRPPKQLDINYEKEDVGSQFIDFWQKTDPNAVFRVDDAAAKKLGVESGFHSGLPTLDKILAVKAKTRVHITPLCRMIEVFGPEMSGKTTYAKFICSKIISMGGIAIFVDWEHKYDPNYLYLIAKMNFGLEEEYVKSRLLYIDPENVEWFNIWIVKMINTIIHSKFEATKALKELENKPGKKPSNFDDLKKRYLEAINMPFVVVNDSVAAMYTEAEINGEEENQVHIALLAREFSKKLKLMRRRLKFAETLIMFINQERDLINTSGYSRGTMMTTTGGKALKYYCDARVRSTKIGDLKRTRNDIQLRYGSEHQFRVVKNQLGVPPFRTTILRLLYDRGFYAFHNLLEACVEEGIIKREGSYFHIKAGTLDLKLMESALDEEQVKIEQQMPGFEKELSRIYLNYIERKQ